MKRFELSCWGEDNSFEKEEWRMDYLMVISLGPVQEFIASARRSRDLWFGSWLLSEISKAAAKTIHSHAGCELIFPSPMHPETDLAPDSKYSVVNKLVARVETENIHTFCESVYGEMLERLSDIKKDAFESLKSLRVEGKDGKAAIHWDNANAQLSDLIEFHWAACPFDGSTYYLVRKQTEALLAARKATGNFKQVAWGGNVPKSSLDGLRESVIDEDVFNPLDVRNLTDKQKAEIQKKLRLKYQVRGKERLCGISLLKRHGKPKENAQGIDTFFSTSHVAALPLLNRLNDQGKQAVKAYMDKLKNLLGISDDEIKAYLGHIHPKATLKPHKYFGNGDGSLLYDGHLLFKERLREFFPDHDIREKAEDALSCFLKDAFGTEKNPSPSPHPYYVILHADGDRMGAVINEQAKKDNGMQEHQRLSHTLSMFAGMVKEIIEVGHNGSCIYAGGDDVLALLPLHTALQCARALADEFQNTLEKGKFTDEDGKPPTLSVGLAVGHHLDPLQDTLNLAREAEEIAKKEVPNKRSPEKNALAITLSKRSGTDRTVKGSWDKAKGEGALDSRLNRFVFLHLEDELPDRVAYELRDLALRLKPPKGADEEQKKNLLEAQRAEAKRILKRKQPKHGRQEKPATKVLNEFCGMKDPVNDKAGFLDLINLENWTLGNLADEIIIAREFAKAIKQAGTETEKEFAKDHGFVEEQKEQSNDDE
jgi:CRISPR-associated protein Cmr2